MNNLYVIIIFRALTRTIGQCTRYVFYRIIGNKKTFQSLSNESKDRYSDLGNALTQDLLNSIVGTTLFFIAIFFVIAIVFGN